MIGIRWNYGTASARFHAVP